ncbi:MAG: MFS transporter [Solirubrobacterales bacterium]
MRRLLFLACAVVFLDVTFFAVLTPLLPDYKSDFSLSDGGVGVLAGAFAAGTLVVALPAGWLAARVGPRQTLIAGLVGIGIFSPVFGLADSIVLLDVSRFFQGASGALMWAGAISWVVSASPRSRRGEMVGAVIAAAVVGELLGAPIGALAHEIGTEIVFGTVFFAAAVLIAVATTIEDSSEVAKQPIREAVAAVRRSNVPRMVLVLGGPSLAFGFLVVAAPLRMDELGAGPWLIAGSFAVGSAVEAVAGPWIGRVSDRTGRTGPYLIGAAVIAVAITAVGVFNLLPLLAAAVVLCAFGAGLAFTPATTLVTDAATASGLNQGYASGASNVAWGGGQMIGAVGGGFLVGATGYLLPSLLTVGIILLVAVIARGTVQPMPSELPEAS